LSLEISRNKTTNQTQLCTTVVLRIIATGELTWKGYNSEAGFRSYFEAKEEDEKAVVEEGITVDRCIELTAGKTDASK